MIKIELQEMRGVPHVKLTTDYHTEMQTALYKLAKEFVDSINDNFEKASKEVEKKKARAQQPAPVASVPSMFSREAKARAEARKYPQSNVLEHTPLSEKIKEIQESPKGKITDNEETLKKFTSKNPTPNAGKSTFISARDLAEEKKPKKVRKKLSEDITKI